MVCIVEMLKKADSESLVLFDELGACTDPVEGAALAVSILEDVYKRQDYHLFCSAGPETSIAATKTFTSEMYLLALLCAEWSESEELRSLLAKVPDAVSDVLNNIPSRLESFIGDYKKLEAGVVLGRGVLYPIALEGALKILETNCVKMRGYPISDFYHGPLAQIGTVSYTHLDVYKRQIYYISYDIQIVKIFLLTL